MARAEIFKIIDVLSEPDPRSDSGQPRPAPRAGAKTERQHIAPAPSPTLAVTAPLATVVPSVPSVIGDAVVTSVVRTAPLIDLQYVSVPDVQDARLIMLREPESERARSFRLLRHRLLSREDPRVVAVTSARPGEGKTTCAFNLAVALAEDTMMRVLLLEANLKRPALAEMLDFLPAESLVEHIARFSDAGPPYPVVALSGTRLHVAALPPTPIGDARLDRTLFAVTLRDLREAYDYIVVDAASVLESADADVVGECSSGILMAARSGMSRRGDLRRAVAEVAPAPVLGGVLLDA